MKDPCDLATIFADRLMKAQDLDELGRICGEIKARLHDLGDMRSWLLDIWQSAYTGLTTKEIPDSEFLNAEGLKNKEKI